MRLKRPRPYSLLDAQLEASTETASRYGDLYRTFWDGVVPGDTTYWFTFDIPEGVDLYGFARVTTVRDGTINNTFMVRGAVGSTVETMDGYRFDERDGEALSQSKLLRVSAVTGAEARTPVKQIVAATTGSLRAPSIQTEIGAQPAFNQANPPVFRYENPESASVELQVELVFQELTHEQ